MSPTEVRTDGLAIRGSAEADKAYRAYQLHRSGMDWEEVAEKIGYASVMSAQVEVRQYITRAAVQMDNAKKEEVLHLELSRLDALQSAVWDDAMGGDTKAVDSVLKIINTRAKLLGLDMVAQNSGNVTNNTVVVTGNTEDFIQSLNLVKEAG